MDGVTFDLSEVIKTAQLVLKPKMMRSRTGGFETIAEVNKDLNNIATKITQLEPTVKTIQTGKTNIFSSFEQIKLLRDQVARIRYDDSLKDGFTKEKAKDLMEALDGLIVDGVKNGQVTGSADFLKYFTEAGKFFSHKKKVENMTALGKLFNVDDVDKDFLPQTIAQKVVNGEFGLEELDLLKRIMTRHAGGQRGKTARTKLNTLLGDFAFHDLATNPRLAADNIERLKKRDNGKLFEALFPDQSVRNALDDFLVASNQLDNDVVQQLIKKENTNGANALNYIKLKMGDIGGDLELQKFIMANGGYQGKRAQQLRSAFFRDLFDKVKTVDVTDTGKTAINPQLLSKELAKLEDALLNKGGDYGNLKALFGPLNTNGSINVDKNLLETITDMKYYTSFQTIAGDVGGAFQSGEVRASLVANPFTEKGRAQMLGAYQTLFTSDVLARILSGTPSVEQLRQLYTAKERKRISIATQLIQRVINGLDGIEKEDGTYTIKGDATADPDQTSQLNTQPDTQTVTTQQPPINQVSQATLPFDRRTTVPPPAQQKGQGITNFSSLFANDPIGEAIANRRLTQGIGSIG
jgi:hypothetical protein